MRRWAADIGIGQLMLLGALAALAAGQFGRKQGSHVALRDAAEDGSTAFTHANDASQLMLELTELDHPGITKKRRRGKGKCMGRGLPWSDALASTIVWQGEAGTASSCAHKCMAIGDCSLWEWCGCKAAAGCPGCLLFSKQPRGTTRWEAKSFAGAARGESCDFSEEDRCGSGSKLWRLFGGVTKRGSVPPPFVVISRRPEVHHMAGMTVVPDVRASNLDVAELVAWGMMSSAAYRSLVRGGRRVHETEKYALLLSHAFAWKQVVAHDEAAVVLEETEVGHPLNGLPTWSSASAHDKPRITDKEVGAQIAFLAPVEESVAATSRIPPYAITPRAAHILYTHLWTKFYDQVLSLYIFSAGPTFRHRGLLSFMREVCGRAKMTCSFAGPAIALQAPARAPRTRSAHVMKAPTRGVTKVIYVPMGMEDRPIAPAGWIVRPLLAVDVTSVCRKQIVANGGVCALVPGITLPPDLDKILDGVTRFAVADGADVSTSLFGCAKLDVAAFPPFASKAQFSGAMTQQMRQEVSFDKVILASELFFARSTSPIPKILHFIQIGPADLKAHTERAILTWLAVHPSWVVRLWTDKDLADFNLTDFLGGAHKYPQKADILRTEILYRYGGLYVDSDFEAFRPIDPWLEGESAALCNEEDIPGDTVGPAKAVSNGFIGAARFHPVMRRAVVRIQHAALNRQWINQDTGPFFLRQMIEEADLGHFVKIPTRIMFPVSFPDRLNLGKWGCFDKSCASRFADDTVGVHLWNQGAGWSGRHQASANSGQPRLLRVLARIREHNANQKRLPDLRDSDADA